MEHAATSIPLSRRKTASRIAWGKIGAMTVLIVTAVIALFPMYWLFANAFTPISGTPPLTPILVPAFKLDNFQRLLGGTKYYANWMLNSLIVALTVTAWHVIFDTMAGYAFAKRRFPGRSVLFWILLSTLMIPIHVTLIPLYIITRRLGLIDSLGGVILPGTAVVFGIFLMRQYIQTLPSELEEAARVDGAGEFRIFWEIILPLCKPAVAALAIFTFVRFWNDFLWPLIVLNKAQNYTLTVGVANLQGEFMTDWGVIFSGAALAALPMIAFFLAFQKYFLEGVRMGAIKG
ncbi:MAG: carbohydrate ABC transporter permease [Anaerolineae bacterium]|nr:carbohydrate ABC transporter permease [Candidatus Roseilinea sp.]MDW8448373.1 carbohydrate ABC transporter permease [Anaerolineae bacterium]